MQGDRGGSLAQLEHTLREIVAIQRAAYVLQWDQLTYMPPAGVAARAEHLAVLQELAHTRLAQPAMGELLDAAQQATAALPPDSDQACLVRIARRDHDQATKLPAELIGEVARTGALANSAWLEARKSDDFTVFAPWLERVVDLSRRRAEYLGYPETPFDALIAQEEPGMTTASVRAIFDQLRPQLAALLSAIAPHVDTVDDAVLRRTFDEPMQERLAHEVAVAFGYDPRRGRIDRTTHPFEIAFSRDDVRITTRYNTSFLPTSLMGAMHETGHGLYEQGIDPALSGTPLARGVSPAMHESQSRLWENYVGRSRPFWDFFYPRVLAAFPGVLDDVEPERFYRAINRVYPSPIRVEADEVTYCLHIILRFELEVALMDGSLRVADAPAAWNEAMRSYLGITPQSARSGLLQDIHWSQGLGGFQGYALGNIIAAQLWEAATAAHPEIPAAIARGEFGVLLGWLRENIHRHGRKFDPADLLERATGTPLHTGPYLRYLETKCAGIYAL